MDLAFFENFARRCKYIYFQKPSNTRMILKELESYDVLEDYIKLVNNHSNRFSDMEHCVKAMHSQLDKKCEGSKKLDYDVALMLFINKFVYNSIVSPSIRVGGTRLEVALIRMFANSYTASSLSRRLVGYLVRYGLLYEFMYSDGVISGNIVFEAILRFKCGMFTWVTSDHGMIYDDELLYRCFMRHLLFGKSSDIIIPKWFEGFYQYCKMRERNFLDLMERFKKT